MSTAEAIGVGLAIIVVGMVVIAIRGLPAFAWFRSLIDKRVKVFEGSPSEATGFEDECKEAGIPCEVRVGDRDVTLEIWVPEKRARDARALRPNSASSV